MKKRKFLKNIYIEIILLAMAGVLLYTSFNNFSFKKAVPVTKITYAVLMEDLSTKNLTKLYLVNTAGVISKASGTLKDGTSFTCDLPPNDPNLYAKAIANKIDTTIIPSGNFNWVSLIMSAVQLLLLGAVIYFFLKTFLGMGAKGGDGGGGGGPFSFGKSKAKVFNNSNPDVKLKDVIGQEEAKEDVLELVEYLKNPNKFIEIGAKAPKGTLLIGPPGCGKTLMARAIAGEAAVPFYSTSGSEFVEMFVGVGASRVRDMFNQAKKTAPCIIFIDEIDAVGRHRGAGTGGGNDEREQTLNQLLVEMDGFDSNKGILIIAATNRPDILDSALLRPGRFDRRITLSAPEMKDREAILQYYSTGKKLETSVNLAEIAKETPGFTGADLENLFNESALLALRKGKKIIGGDEMEEAIDKILAGPQKKSRVLLEKEKQRVACHEAGHAVLGKTLSSMSKIHRITIISRGEALGFTMQLPNEDRFLHTKEEYLNEIATLFGGRAAEEIIFNTITDGAASDLERASVIAREMVTRLGMGKTLKNMAFRTPKEDNYSPSDLQSNPLISQATAEKIDAEVAEIMTSEYTKAKTTLEEHREGLEKLVKVLLEKETLQGEELETVLNLI
jgi:cell division protease FtsH